MMEGRLGGSECWVAGWLGNQHHGTLSTHTRWVDAMPGCYFALELNSHSPMIDYLDIDMSFYLLQ
jgi:hypothetical protein